MVTLSQNSLIFVSNTSQLNGLVNFIMADWTYVIIELTTLRFIRVMKNIRLI